MTNFPLEDLIRRYESGERDPDLIKQLNDAAWDGFHDPWEAKKPELKLAPHQSFEGEEEAAFDPEALLPFGTDTIQRFLDGREYKYWKSSWDAFLIFWGYSEQTDRVVRAVLTAEGKNLNIFRLRMVCDRRVPAERFDRAFRLCNTWNDYYRWPRAYVEMPVLEKKEGEVEGREPESGSLALDHQLYFAAGVPQVLFDSAVKDALATSWEFWEKAHDEYGL